jgi:hypothetical protein
MSPDDWKKDANGKYVYDSKLTKENTSTKLKAGETYIGSNDSDIIKDIGWTQKYQTAETTKMGYVAADMEDAASVNYGVSHLVTVTAETNINVTADVTTTLDGDKGEVTKTFNGVAINAYVKGTTSGTDNIVATGIATTTYNGQTYSAALGASTGNQITQSGASSSSGSILIPAAQIYSNTGVNIFPGVNITGNWWNTRDDGSGATPVVPHLLAPFPRTYSHTYMPYSGN